MECDPTAKRENVELQNVGKATERGIRDAHYL